MIPAGHSSVMSSRREPHDSLDFFPTPPWATRALCEHVIDIRGKTVWEPACGDGAMAKPLAEYAACVSASDVHDYGFSNGRAVRDFLWPESTYHNPDWIITNPPFRLAEQFVLRGLNLARVGVAVLVRTVFLESARRYENLFKPHPPAIFAPFVERVPMLRGRLDRDASTATSYCWLVWHPNTAPFSPLVKFIPPCRSKLEKESDYGPIRL